MLEFVILYGVAYIGVVGLLCLLLNTSSYRLRELSAHCHHC